jgi:hypothetical protein
MEKSVQLPAQADLSPGKEPTVLTGEEVGWVSEPIWALWREKSLLSCRESNPDRPARSPSLYQLSYPCSCTAIIIHHSVNEARKLTALISTLTIDYNAKSVSSAIDPHKKVMKHTSYKR